MISDASRRMLRLVWGPTWASCDLFPLPGSRHDLDPRSAPLNPDHCDITVQAISPIDGSIDRPNFLAMGNVVAANGANLSVDARVGMSFRNATLQIVLAPPLGHTTSVPGVVAGAQSGGPIKFAAGTLVRFSPNGIPPATTSPIIDSGTTATPQQDDSSVATGGKPEWIARNVGAPFVGPIARAEGSLRFNGTTQPAFFLGCEKTAAMDKSENDLTFYVSSRMLPGLQAASQGANLDQKVTGTIHKVSDEKLVVNKLVPSGQSLFLYIQTA